MAIYIVSYDLREEKNGRDWNRLYEVLKSTGTYCWPLESAWIIETTTSPSGVINVLIKEGAIDDNDGIIVLEITGSGAWRRVNSTETADWLQKSIQFV